jgi:hypothetical protein
MGLYDDLRECAGFDLRGSIYEDTIRLGAFQS